ncbi:MAG: DUF1549 domain-containing protein [Pirellulaceae bacterium]|nr:DUF1549 domain-containing protein [Pirellulaceae bacterium]
MNAKALRWMALLGISLTASTMTESSISGTNIAAAADPKPVDFSHEVVPLLKKHCVKCHAGDSKKGGFSFNTRQDLVEGSENGPVVELGKADASRLIDVVISTDADERMPPEGDRLSRVEVDLLKRWINEGAKWEDGFAFKAPAYEPPLRPRKPELPAARQGRTHPIDRIIDQHLTQRNQPTPPPVSDAVFARRAWLDLTGLLPEPEKLSKFLKDSRTDKRARLIDDLLADDVAYAEHWLTFWNDLLRNDYDGTGFITGGRKQISGWLYQSLVINKPYDQFVRELIAPPSEDSRGFIEGIKWRGEVSAGQTVEIQFAQSISQSLLGINMKCASCHDSFIDRWKLEEAYGLAAIYATKPLEIHRCDKPIGKTATATWLFPELGQVDAGAPPAERLKQLAGLLTHPENGRLTRTMTNRLWHRLMGHGVVHPTDSMQTEPWNADLLDFLGSDFAEHGYDLKHTLRLIANSQAYQSRSEILSGEDIRAYQYAGPRARRMTAEQFIDTLWQLTGSAPTKMDAKFLRGKLDPELARQLKLGAQWIWSSTGQPPAAAGEKRSFRKKFTLDQAVDRGGAVIDCDNKFTLYVDGKKVASGDNWNVPSAISLGPLAKGEHELLIVGENQGDSPNPAGLYFEARFDNKPRGDKPSGDKPKSDKPDSHSQSVTTIVSDSSWEWSATLPRDNGKFAKVPDDWQPAVPLANQGTWAAVTGELQNALARANHVPMRMMRAALLKADPLMRSLGRPNRDQIVSMRPNDLSTLEALDLANGSQVAKILSDGSSNLLARDWRGAAEFTEWLYLQALCRQPSTEELAIAVEMLGDQLSARGVEDLLWAVVMLPEYQIVR